MNIRDCQYLTAVDELKSFIKAAQKCHISQPALSQQIQKVESQLGVKIFERNNKVVITTQKGGQVIEHCKTIVQSYQKIKHIKNANKEVKLALIPTICPYLLPHLVEEMTKKVSRIKFYFLEQKTADILNDLLLGKIDMAVIAYFDNLLDAKLDYLPLYEEGFMLVLPKSSAKTIADLPQILQDKELILLAEGNCISDNIRDICSMYSQSSFNDFQATTIETVKNMIRMGNGVGLLPALACQSAHNLQVIDFDKEKTRKVVLVFRKNYDDKAIIKTVASIIAKTAQQLLAHSANKSKAV